MTVGGVRAGRGWCLRSLLALMAAAVATLATAVPAAAHAVLVETEPADGATLDEAPDAVTLRFNEPVEAVEGGVRVHDAAADRVDADVAAGAGDEVVEVTLPEDLSEGGYLVVYRVVSADGHAIRGVIGFTVGSGGAVADDVAADLLGADGAVGSVGALLRGVGYLGTLAAAGAVAFALLVARRDDDRRRARRLGALGAGTAIGAALLALPVQTIALAGVGPLEALRPAAIAETLGSSFGQGWLLRVAALALLIPVLRRGGPAVGLAALAVAAPASFLLEGHTRSVEPWWVLVPGDAAHLAAGSVWLGGLLVLAASLRARAIDDDPVDAARLVSRFSTLAAGCLAVMAVSGVAMGVPLVRVPEALVSTGYGWTLLAKLGLVALVVAVAYYNRSRLVPAIAARAVPAGGSVDVGGAADADARRVRRSRAAWGRLRGSLRGEALLLVAVVLVTGFLAVQRPAADQAGATGLYEERVAVTDELDLELVVDPNRAGETNAVHVYVVDASGRPTDEVEQVELELVYAPEDIGPFQVEPFPAGPGHWVANVDDLVYAGTWRLRASLVVDRFTEESVELTVPVR